MPSCEEDGDAAVVPALNLPGKAGQSVKRTLKVTVGVKDPIPFRDDTL